MVATKELVNMFLMSMSTIYLMAFASLYLQIPGLYGNNGILPARLHINRGLRTVYQVLTSDQPSLVRLFPVFGLNTDTMMDFVVLIGMFLSALSIILESLRNSLVYAILWLCYFSMYLIGQTFMSFQWDILLLEVGILTIILSPIIPTSIAALGEPYHQNISFWLIKWLLFRLMFASGVVKIQSHCPTWWGLTALEYHFESQCIPTPLSYYMHHLPPWLLKLGVVQTYVTQIGLSFLFFSPLRSLRVFAFWMHVSHQVLILLTGNYNFFNFLTILIALPLLTDYCRIPAIFTGYFRLIDAIIQGCVYAFISYWSITLFSLKLEDDNTISSNVAFTKEDFAHWVQSTLPITMVIGVFSLAYEIILSINRCYEICTSKLSCSFRLTQCILYGFVAIFMFSISLVPHTAINREVRNQLPTFVHTFYTKVHQFQFTSSYGLFRSMTGVGGRPELVIEGSHDPDGGWVEYEFLYKPGNLSRAPPFVAPHQPRLDWQMWFAALGSFQHNPWFLNLAYRLLTNQKEVLNLLAHNPFPHAPPTYVQATLYHYHYTPWTRSQRHWWKRDWQRQYLPIIGVDDVNFINYLRTYKIIDHSAPRKTKNSPLLTGITFIRWATWNIEAFYFIIFLLIFTFVLRYVYMYYTYVEKIENLEAGGVTASVSVES